MIYMESGSMEWCNMIVTVDARLQAQNYDHVAFKQMVAKLMIHYDLLFS